MEVVGLLVRVGCVFGLLFLALHLLRRVNGLKTTRRAAPMQVVGSTRIGKGAALTVVRIGDSEYVLGVTDHTVTLITTGVPAAVPAAAAAASAATASAATASAASAATVPSSAPAAHPDFAAALGARLSARSADRTADPLQVPPTPAEFLRSAYRVARRRPAESTDLSNDAVDAALASVRGDEAVPAPRTSSDDVPAPAAVTAPRTALTPQPVAPDGTAAPTPRHALRRAVARTEALRHEEPQWPRSSRPTSRTATSGVLV